MQRLTRAVVTSGLLFAVLAAQEADIESQPPCNIEEFGVDESCHECEIFHTQMLEDGVNLTTRCGWPPEGSNQRPPSEFANRSFNVGKRPICESCNGFYQRLLHGSPPFNLTEKCGWQMAASILNESSPPLLASGDSCQQQVDGSPLFRVKDNSCWPTTASILDNSSPPKMTSCTWSDWCLLFTVCCAVSVVINVVIAIYCCLMRSRKYIQKRPCQKCLICGRPAPSESLTSVVVSPPSGSPPLNGFSDTDGTSLLCGTDRPTLNGRSSSSTKSSKSSNRKKNNLRNGRRKTNP